MSSLLSKTLFAPLTTLKGGTKLLALGLSLGPCGFFPVAPGTVGSLFTVLILALFPIILGNEYLAALLARSWFWWGAGGLTLLLFYLGKLAIDRLLLSLGPQDFAWIVFDEALGIWLTALLALAIVVGRGGSAAILSL
ncbi:MAG: phosphatidylglycerophosphatase A, partial [Bacteriovoracaceae bacterium]|nr:phosphatidylglycerophosphatase A [Bacteriovoracaceae bacterium]